MICCSVSVHCLKGLHKTWTFRYSRFLPLFLDENPLQNYPRESPTIPNSVWYDNLLAPPVAVECWKHDVSMIKGSKRIRCWLQQWCAGRIPQECDG